MHYQYSKLNIHLKVSQLFTLRYQLFFHLEVGGRHAARVAGVERPPDVLQRHGVAPERHHDRVPHLTCVCVCVLYSERGDGEGV